MKRTIHIIFIGDKISSTKKYAFLCSNNDVKVGDIIIGPRYTSDMQVVEIDPCDSRIQGGHIIKDIKIELLNGKYYQDNDPDTNKQNNMNTEQKRTIEVTLRNDVNIYQSTNVYPGVTYFKNQEDAIKAINILEDRVKELF